MDSATTRRLYRPHLSQRGSQLSRPGCLRQGAGATTWETPNHPVDGTNSCTSWCMVRGIPTPLNNMKVFFFIFFGRLFPIYGKTNQWRMACPLFIGFLHLFLASKLVQDFFHAEYDREGYQIKWLPFSVEIQFPACSSFHWRSASMPCTKANLDGLQIDWQWSAKSHSFAYCLGEERAFVGKSLRWFELGSSVTKIIWDIPWTSYQLLIHSLTICWLKSPVTQVDVSV